MGNAPTLVRKDMKLDRHPIALERLAKALTLLDRDDLVVSSSDDEDRALDLRYV